MADDKLKQATCPICGYTDSATDAEALATSMQEHMRLMHNQVLSTDPANLDLKDTGAEATDEFKPGPGAVLVMPPNNNAGNAGQFPVARADHEITDRD
jgi:hypothetical protein